MPGDVLEVGAGTGLNLSIYGPEVASLTLTEPEPPMLKRLRKRAADVAPTATVLRAPAEDLPFDDNTFDVVVSTLVLCGVSDQPRALREIHRVLRPGGELRFVEWIGRARDEIRVLNLGHPVPLLIAAEVKPLDARPTPPLGAIDWPVEEPTVIALPDQWQLFFYTDGLIEGRLGPDFYDRYGVDRLVKSLQTLACERIDRTCLEGLISTIEAGGGQPFADDVAVMLISKAEPADRPAADSASGARAAIRAGSA